MNTIDPLRFVGKELAVHPTSRGQCSILLDGIVIGRVNHLAESATWRWQISGPDLSRVDEAPTSGEARTLSDAKLAIRRSVDQWLKWSLPQGGEVAWMDFDEATT